MSRGQPPEIALCPSPPAVWEGDGSPAPVSSIARTRRDGTRLRQHSMSSVPQRRGIVHLTKCCAWSVRPRDPFGIRRSYTARRCTHLLSEDRVRVVADVSPDHIDSAMLITALGIVLTVRVLAEMGSDDGSMVSNRSQDLNTSQMRRKLQRLSAAKRK